MATIGNQAAQRSYLRRAVGHAEDTALISDDLLDDCLTDALREVNLTWPSIGVGSFQTVADQQLYTPLNAIAGETYRVRRVFWPQACTQSYPNRLVDELNSLLLPSDEDGAIRYTLEPAAVLGVMRFKEYMRKWFEGYAKIDPPDNVYLLPPPTEAGLDVYFMYSQARYAAMADVRVEHGQAYYAYAKMCLHQALASGRGALESVTSPAGVSMRTGARSSHLEMAAREERKWNSYLPPISTARSWP